MPGLCGKSAEQRGCAATDRVDCSASSRSECDRWVERGADSLRVQDIWQGEFRTSDRDAELNSQALFMVLASYLINSTFKMLAG